MKWTEKIRQAIAAGHVAVIAGRCSISYVGRASSELGEGERLVIIKRDGSVLVHRPSGYEPVNWQPSGSKIELYMEDDAVVLRAARADEVLKIRFHGEPQVNVYQLVDEAEMVMYASEAEMKRAVLMRPELIEEGFRAVEEERAAGRAGKVDVFGVDKNGVFTVVELKRRAATPEDVKQLGRYLESLAEEWGKRPRGIIAAPSATKHALSLMKTMNLEFRCLTPRTCMEVLRKQRGLDAHL
ncbi:conserved hypothetical protein [Candidatus Caldarchaeum subterraneum]|uniref:Endonuclease NucS n=1 Tax=Caldiarchaeum subterraneum TaxID=311458 RepID=E6N3D0_CALS0|nr:hypothetical conserved protein [Candidatus Caldarchaeum subterraneum]BAJ48300.1 conserved hypothetical protein [Candidatus Caldarchaeum subterraneum]BAJ49593.1 conserved hypothetical protein [Candidatus Caldarchaeum subterraneum]BAJ51068.1 conserved hypothetical protein [Candidatus Caldarchaeum subterraneum]GBC72241.1 Endonuclease NucS [archaeon HR03]